MDELTSLLFAGRAEGQPGVWKALALISVSAFASSQVHIWLELKASREEPWSEHWGPQVLDSALPANILTKPPFLPPVSFPVYQVGVVIPASLWGGIK